MDSENRSTLQTKLSSDKQARAMIDLLGKPVNVVDKIREKNRKAVWKKVSERLFPKIYNNHMFIQEIELTKSVKLLDFNFKSALKDLKDLHLYKELYIQRLVMSYEPFICRGMSGMLSILFCDCRSSLMDNILKVGFTVPVAEEAQGLTICPGYKVSLNDPNLHKIFRFFVLTAGLDLDRDSIYGKLSLAIHFTLAKSCKVSQSNFSSLTLVGTAQAVSMFSDKHGPALVEEESFEDLELAFKSLEDNSDSKIQTFTHMTDILKRSMSARSDNLLVNNDRRFSDVGSLEMDAEAAKLFFSQYKGKGKMISGAEGSSKLAEETPALVEEPLSPVLKAKGPCGYKHFITKSDIEALKSNTDQI